MLKTCTQQPQFRGLGFVKSRQHGQEISRCLQLDDLQLVQSQIHQEHYFFGEFKYSHLCGNNNLL